MEKTEALSSLSALGQETRLDVFRLLIKAGPEGLSAGAISERLNVKSNTLSTHLSALSRSGLVHAKRDGRSITYSARIDQMQNLILYLMQDCCEGNPDLCDPIAGAVDQMAKRGLSSRSENC